MADPAVCSFITKLLCSNGGCSTLEEILPLLGLPEHQLLQILEDSGQERFLMIHQPEGGGGGGKGSCQVLALSPVRLCKRQECPGCQHLHFCKNFSIKGRCFGPSGGRGACKYSHDLLSEENRKVLKNHELSGLNEKELCVLLLQNDPFLLPEVCSAYNKGRCNMQDDCTKLHICWYFLRGQCRFPQCKRSHCLMEPKALKLLLAEGVDDKAAFNIQTICEHRSAALVGELSKPKSSSTSPNEGSSSSHNELNQEKSNAGNQSKSIPEQSFGPTDVVNHRVGRDRKGITKRCPLYKMENKGVTIARGTRSTQNAEKEKIDEICLYYIFGFCKNKNNCSMIHYHLPYRWQIKKGNGWNDLPNGEEIEKAYCDPGITSLLDLDINFETMTSSTAPIRRLSTPSSVTKPPKFVMTTKWLWYWKNDVGQWIEYGNQDGKIQDSSLGSDDLENLFLAEPDEGIHFKAGSENYVISFKEMTQTNVNYLTKREVQRRPKFVSPEDVKTKKGHTATATPVPATIPVPATSPAPATSPVPAISPMPDTSPKPAISPVPVPSRVPAISRVPAASPALATFPAPATSQVPATSRMPAVSPVPAIFPVPATSRAPGISRVPDTSPEPDIFPLPLPKYPITWDMSALPLVGYKAIELSQDSSEYIQIKNFFQKTMSGYAVKKIRRIQNPSLWEIFQWQKEQMKKKKGGQNVNTRLLFHGTSSSNVEAICNDNFDWRICGTNGTVYGKGSYFARDARYSHNYCQSSTNKKVMFVAEVLVGDFIVGRGSYCRPPAKPTNMFHYYDSCVDNMTDPSIFVIFEKHQIYPAYTIDYIEEEKCILF